MATNTKLSQFRGQEICLQRFAYDVFKYSAIKFQAPEVCIAKWEGVENKYGPPDFITVLSRIIFKYQITQRTNWGCLFYVRYFMNKFTSLEELSNALQVVLEFSRKEAEGCVFHEVLVSLAVISELIRYLYNISSKMYMKELAAFWTEYFCCYLRKNFEEAGGFTVMYEVLNQPKYDSLDVFYNELIPRFCSPYEDSAVFPRLYDLFYDESRKYYERITKNLSEEEKHQYNVVFNATVFRQSRRAMSAKEILLLALPTEIGAFRPTKPEGNTTEKTEVEALRNFNTGDAATSCFPTTSQLESQPSLRSIVDNFSKLKVASPKRTRFNKPEKDASDNQPSKKGAFDIQPPEDMLRDTGASVGYATTSTRNSPYERAQEIVMKSRWRPNKAELLRRKSSSSSTGEVSKQLDNKPSKKGAFDNQPPEDLLRDTGASVGYATTSSRNLPCESAQEIAMKNTWRPIKAEGLRRKSSSSSTGEVSEQLDLGSSKTEPESLIPHSSGDPMEEFNKWLNQKRCIRSTISVENITLNDSFKNHLLDSFYGEDVVTSLRNLCATIVQESRRRSRTSSQLEGRKRKPSSSSCRRDFDQLDLGPSETKHFREVGSTCLVTGSGRPTKKNELPTTSLKEARERRKSSSQLEGRKRKPSSSSSTDESDLGPSEMDLSCAPGSSGLVIGLKSLTEKNELVISSLKEPRKRRRSSSQVEGFEMNYSYLPNAEAIDQSDLGPSAMDFSCEPGPSGLVIDSESLAEKNELSISNLKGAGKRGSSPSQLEVPKRKPSSSSGTEDSDQLHWGASVMKTRLRKPEGAGPKSLAEQNKLVQEKIFEVSCNNFMNWLLRFDLHERVQNQDEFAKVVEELRKRGLDVPSLDSESPWYKDEENEGDEGLI